MTPAQFAREQIREASRQLAHYKRLLAAARAAVTAAADDEIPHGLRVVAQREADVRNATQRLADVRKANG